MKTHVHLPKRWSSRRKSPPETSIKYLQLSLVFRSVWKALRRQSIHQRKAENKRKYSAMRVYRRAYSTIRCHRLLRPHPRIFLWTTSISRKFSNSRSTTGNSRKNGHFTADKTNWWQDLLILCYQQCSEQPQPSKYHSISLCKMTVAYVTLILKILSTYTSWWQSKTGWISALRRDGQYYFKKKTLKPPEI